MVKVHLFCVFVCKNSTVWSTTGHSDGLSLAQKAITFLVLLNASQWQLIFFQYFYPWLNSSCSDIKLASYFKAKSFSILKVKMCPSMNLVFPVSVCVLSVYIYQSCASLSSHVEIESAEQLMLVCGHLHCVSSFLSWHIYTFCVLKM